MPTWHPVDVQHKLTYNKSKLWSTKQSALRGTKDIINETPFRKSLSNGSTFIACIKTSNLKSHNQDDEQKVKNFIVDLGEPYIWCCARGLFKPRGLETNFEKFSTEYIDVPNLKFDAYDENDLMRVYCPMNDIYVALQMECEDTVSVFYHEEVFSSKKHRQKKYIKPTKKYESVFKKAKKKNNEKENNPDLFEAAGTSGLNSSSHSLSQNTNTQKSHSADNGVEGIDETRNDDARNDDARNDEGRNDEGRNKKAGNDEAGNSDEVLSKDSRKMEKGKDQVTFQAHFIEITAGGRSHKFEIRDFKRCSAYAVGQVGFLIDTSQLSHRK